MSESSQQAQILAMVDVNSQTKTAQISNGWQ
jgi:hypothetical protein